MPLQYPPFAACSAMVAASRNAPPLRSGARGTAVGLLQGALIQLGFRLPYSTLAKGVPDCIFGDETYTVLRQFQERHKANLVADGLAGRDTVTYLDGLAHCHVQASPIPSVAEAAASDDGDLSGRWRRPTDCSGHRVWAVEFFPQTGNIRGSRCINRCLPARRVRGHWR